MSRQEAYEQAAVCYRRAGLDLEAARCYRAAGAHRRAAEIYEAVGRHAEAAAAFADAGLAELGAWLLVHRAAQPTRARAVLGPEERESSRGAPLLGQGAWPRLEVRIGPDRDLHSILSAGSEYSIGRDPTADIMITDARVSWRHAVVRTEGNAWIFEDTSSANGSWVDHQDQRIMRQEIPPPILRVRLGSRADGPLLRFEYPTVTESDWGTVPGPPGLRRRLILARCNLAEGAPADDIRPVIADVCAALADPNIPADQVAEEWAVAVSETAARYDQGALVFAAAMRGGRYGAAQRWQSWSRRVLGTGIILPPPTVTARTTAAA